VKKRKKENKKIKELIAYHEAGHAIAAFAMRKKFTYIALGSHPDIPGSEGVVWTRPQKYRKAFKKVRGQDLWVANDLKIPTKESIEREIVVLLAGSAAQCRYETKKAGYQTGTHDYKVALNLASKHLDSTNNEGLMDKLAAISGLLLNLHWHRVKILAATLLKEDRIGYMNARRLCNWHDPWAPASYLRFSRS